MKINRTKPPYFVPELCIPRPDLLPVRFLRVESWRGEASAQKARATERLRVIE